MASTNMTLKPSLWVLIVALACPTICLGQDAESGSKAVNRNAKGPQVAARAPGLMVRDGIAGPQITQSEADQDQPTRLQRVNIDIINTLFLGLNQLVPFLPALFAPGDDGAGPSGIGSLIITEIANDGTNSFVEVFNPGSIRLELDEWAFCKLDQCTTRNETAGIVMEGGDLLVFQLGGQFDSTLANAVITLQVGTTADDIAIYDFTGAPERDPQDQIALRDYVQWGDFFQSFGLEDLAVTAGLWVSGSSIESSLANNSFQLESGSLTIGGVADNYFIVPFEQHSLTQLTPAEDGGS